MSAIAAIISLDARGIMRDGVMLTNLMLSLVVVTAITLVGYYQSGNTSAQEWYPFLIVVSIITGPGGFGFMFGLLMVDESDTGVRSALSIIPIHPLTMLLTRTVLIVSYLLIWPVLTVFLMDITWQSLPIDYLELFCVAASVALLGPVTSLAIAAYATNKVEALALFKLISFIVIAPLALKFLPPDTWYASLFLLAPSAWAYLAFDMFVAGEVQTALTYTIGGIAYNGFLLGLCIRYYQKTQYKTL